MKVAARTLVPGRARGPAVHLSAPLSFWGGVDPMTGRVVDHGHPQRGAALAGRIVTLTAARGSSSSSSVLAETLRAGCGPLAVVLAEPDPILTVGSLVAAELYAITCPLVVVAEDDLGTLRASRILVVTAGPATAQVEAVDANE